MPGADSVDGVAIDMLDILTLLEYCVLDIFALMREDRRGTSLVEVRVALAEEAVGAIREMLGDPR